MMISTLMIVEYKETYLNENKKIMKYLKILTIGCLLLSSSIVFGQKYAKEFLNNQERNSTRTTVYLSVTDDVIKTNSQHVLSSSNIIDSIDNKQLVSTFYNELKAELKFLGFNVVEKETYLPSTPLNDNEFSLYISQIEIEQTEQMDSINNVYNYQDDSEGLMDNLVFYKVTGGLSFNVWLNFSAQDTTENKIFYTDIQMKDALSGYIEKNNPFSKDTTFVTYSLTEVNTNDAYVISFLTGTNAARYFFNFLMNRYVWIKSEGKDTKYYWINDNRKIESSDIVRDNFDVLQ
ncbi:MAG: hypothetical protein IJ213_06700 [Bacteroidales bacterium]|nr:hypothetical protein [Bacteroidales bacterium]